MDNDHERLKRIRSGVLGLAVILALFGLLMLVPALYWAAGSHWQKAAGPIVVGPVALIFAFKFYAEWLRMRHRNGA